MAVAPNDKITGPYFSQQEIDYITKALDQAISSAKRGYNTTKVPEFKPIFDKQVRDMAALIVKISS